MKILKFREVIKCANARKLKELCLQSGSRSVCSTRSNWLAASPPKSNAEEGADPVLRKKYSDTLQLPKTSFPMKVPFQKRSAHDLQIADVIIYISNSKQMLLIEIYTGSFLNDLQKMQFDQLYGLQRLWRQEQPEFILHDGPPYANGSCHIGHAVNKVILMLI